MKETNFDYIDTDNYATFCTAEKKWINKIHKLQQTHAHEIEILYEPEDNGGILLCHIPKNWLKVSPPRKINLTEAQRAERAERLKNARVQGADDE